MQLLTKLFGFDLKSRGFDQRGIYGIGLGGSKLSDLQKSIEKIYIKCIDGKEEVFVKEIEEILRFRAIFYLLPQECLFGDPQYGSKPIIRKHLENCGIDPDDDLVRAIKFFCDNFRNKRNKGRKKGYNEVIKTNPDLFKKIMREQNERCGVCGIKLSKGLNLQLDHILPWYLGDDPNDGSNWQFLCSDCNLGKSNDPYYSLNKSIWNHIGSDMKKDELRLNVRFATLVRDGKCVHTHLKPSQTELTVVKKIKTGCWVLDNVQSVSTEYAEHPEER